MVASEFVVVVLFGAGLRDKVDAGEFGFFVVRVLDFVERFLSEEAGVGEEALVDGAELVDTERGVADSSASF